MPASTRHLVDPELLPMVDFGDALNVSAETLPQARAALLAMSAANRPPPRDDVEQREVTVPTADGRGEIRLLVHVPRAPRTDGRLRPAVLHVHGGGFILGNADMSVGPNQITAARHDAVVVSVDYRLAPETPFPGPVEDCYTGLQWLFANAAELGVDPDRVALLGESGGGGIAAALAHVARDRGRQPCAQVLIYPMIDHRTGTEADAAMNPLSGEFGWTRAFNRFGWDAMRGDGDIDPERMGHFSPSRAADVSGLPPTFIAVGTLDLFVDEDIAYANRLLQAGVAVELHVYPGAVHAFDMLPTAAVTRQFVDDRERAMARYLGSA